MASEELARRLNAAYTILSDPLKRQAYDRTIRQEVIQDQIMQRYVGGFQTFDTRAAPRFQHPEPTAAERRERATTNRQASFTLVLYAVAVTVIILVALVVGSLLGSALQAVR